jgi:hypothetical protein
VTTPPHHTPTLPADAAKETPAVPASTPRQPHNANADTTDADTGGVVLPFRRPSTRDQMWTVESIDTEPMTAQHYDQAVSTLAVLIGQWKDRRNTDDGDEKAA